MINGNKELLTVRKLWGILGKAMQKGFKDLPINLMVGPDYIDADLNEVIIADKFGCMYLVGNVKDEDKDEIEDFREIGSSEAEEIDLEREAVSGISISVREVLRLTHDTSPEEEEPLEYDPDIAESA